MYLSGNNTRLKSKIWEQKLLFNLLKVLGVPYPGNNAVDFCYVDDNQAVSSVRLHWDQSDFVNKPLVPDMPVPATGALAACQVNSERMQIVWVGEGGRLEAIDPFCYPSSVDTRGGGSIAAVSNLQGRGESVMWCVDVTGCTRPLLWWSWEGGVWQWTATSVARVATTRHLSSERLSELQPGEVDKVPRRRGLERPSSDAAARVCAAGAAGTAGKELRQELVWVGLDN
ncbi:hypothetical protein EDB81DRAFT_885700 [Dactylonectria macrodidyma]|uniref:Uncharacterized protein n=1 Tax=Dactylonectria macrodidyma TaxID=307937 RepID=A0A9P9EP61_9HYPO|nr:hypothetical protein EDB81DRAFT_885700 [Dactylonectria macrodidyma]